MLAALPTTIASSVKWGAHDFFVKRRHIKALAVLLVLVALAIILLVISAKSDRDSLLTTEGEEPKRMSPRSASLVAVICVLATGVLLVGVGSRVSAAPRPNTSDDDDGSDPVAQYTGVSRETVEEEPTVAPEPE
jgi:ABC-type Fe3+ transport system permease subunit